ncbi:MAG: DUF4124 domain-containing protein [Steroidobacteraceae bacterium]
MPRPALVVALLTAMSAGGAVHAPVALAQAQTKPAAPTYKWVDEKGVIHYGDRVPTEASTRERAVLNRQGVEVGKLEAQKTAEQAAAELRRAQAITQLKDHDAFLLNTYASVKDIELLRDQRLKQMADQRKSTENYIETLENRLDALQTRARVFRPYNDSPTARRLPDQLAEDLVRTVNEVRRQRIGLDERRAEESKLLAQFQADIERFKVVKYGSAQPR